MVKKNIKNWDNKTWLSSKNYINSFNNFLIKNFRINSRFKILDIGCGRGKILGSLCSKLKLKQKPLGIPKGFCLSFNLEQREPKIFPRPHPISKILNLELILKFLIKKLLNELI